MELKNNLEKVVNTLIFGIAISLVILWTKRYIALLGDEGVYGHTILLLGIALGLLIHSGLFLSGMPFGKKHKRLTLIMLKDPFTLRDEGKKESYEYFDQNIRSLPKNEVGEINTKYC